MTQGRAAIGGDRGQGIITSDPGLGLIQPITLGPDLAAVIRGTRALQADTIYSQYKPQVLYIAVKYNTVACR